MSRQLKLVVSGAECTYMFGPYDKSDYTNDDGAASVRSVVRRHDDAAATGGGGGPKPNNCGSKAKRLKRKPKPAVGRDRLRDAVFCVTSDNDDDDDDEQSDDVNLSLSDRTVRRRNYQTGCYRLTKTDDAPTSDTPISPAGTPVPR